MVLVRPRKSQEVLKICNGKCIGINLACKGKNRIFLIASDLIEFWGLARACRFHRDNSALVRDPKVFIDGGRQMPPGSSAEELSVSEEARRRSDVASSAGWKKERERSLLGATMNPERSYPPVLKVLLLLSEHQQESGWVEKTRIHTSEW